MSLTIEADARRAASRAAHTGRLACIIYAWLVGAVCLAPAMGFADSALQGVVNINEAPAEELVRLPGIGATRAQAIVRTRERRRFARVEHILRVKGIGRKMFRRLRPFLTVEGPTSLKRGPSEPSPPRTKRP